MDLSPPNLQADKPYLEVTELLLVVLEAITPWLLTKLIVLCAPLISPKANIAVSVPYCAPAR